MTDKNFPDSTVKHNQQEMNRTKMAAPNAEPFGKVGGMKSPNEHSPNKSGRPASSVETGGAGPGQGVAPHGTPGKNPKNSNKLH